MLGDARQLFLSRFNPSVYPLLSFFEAPGFSERIYETLVAPCSDRLLLAEGNNLFMTAGIFERRV